MVEPKLVCKVGGKQYHEGKDMLKAIRNKHGIMWDKRIGTRTHWFWKGRKEYLRGHPKELAPEKRGKVYYFKLKISYDDTMTVVGTYISIFWNDFSSSVLCCSVLIESGIRKLHA